MTAAGAVSPIATLSGCATVSVRVQPAGKTLDELLPGKPRIMWVGAHPDDEVLVGAIVAKASLVYHCPLYFLVMNHGDGGECCRPEGCNPDVATVRGEEMQEVARLYGAELQHEWFYNAPLPVSSFPKRHEIAEIWRAHKDPTLVCAQAVRRFKPDVLLTFGPSFGATGHPEHQLASRFATAGVRLAADKNAGMDGLAPHRVDRVYYGLNSVPLARALGGGDPEQPTEIFDASQHCRWGMSCSEVMAWFTRPHKTQANDMGAVRLLRFLLNKNYLRSVDPFSDIANPYEPVV